MQYRIFPRACMKSSNPSRALTERADNRTAFEFDVSVTNFRFLVALTGADRFTFALPENIYKL